MKRLRGRPFHGLYAITDAGFKGLAIERQVEMAIRGGARVIQYRDKSLDAPLRQTEAKAILSVCRRFDVPLLINDDVELAAAIGADGVHLGSEDTTLASARRQLGPRAIIGVSCYNRFELAERAVATGADYVAFGRFFTSQSKPLAVGAGLDLLHRARAELDCPVVAIGGITPENGRLLVEAGADMLAVIRGVFAAPDVTEAAQSLHNLFPSDPENDP
jgi:thiamine-phosphate pyrophosphorylase